MNIIIKKEFISKKKYTIVKNSKEESEFMKNFIRKSRNLDIVNITNKLSLESIVQEYTDITESICILHSQ